MTRRLLILAVFLVAGAVVNVGVALCVCLSSEGKVSHQMPPPVPEWIRKLGVPPEYFIFRIEEEHQPSFGMDRRWYSTRTGYLARYTSVGWPLRCFTGRWHYDQSTGESEYVGAIESPLTAEGTELLLPIGPIWPGFAVNTLFYAAVIWLPICGPFALRRFIRLERGLCLSCAYPVGDSDVCSECGKEKSTRPAGLREIS